MHLLTFPVRVHPLRVLRLDAVSDEKQVWAAKRESISRFFSDLRQRDGIVEAFEEELWYATVDVVTKAFGF